MAERILVVDPGERVGWCHADIKQKVRSTLRDGRIQREDPRNPLGHEGSSYEDFYDVEVTGHGITPWKDFVLKLVEVVGNYDTVILESYRIYAHMARHHIGSDVPTLQCVGQVKLCCWLNPKVKLVMQAPDVQKNGIKVAPPPIREILDRLPKSHDEAHDGSALAHLSQYWFKHYAT